MSDLTQELRAEIAQHFRESRDIRRPARSFANMERGLTGRADRVQPAAPRLGNARNYGERLRGAMLCANCTTAPSIALKSSRLVCRYLAVGAICRLRSAITYTSLPTSAPQRSTRQVARRRSPFVFGSLRERCDSSTPRRHGAARLHARHATWSTPAYASQVNAQVCAPRLRKVPYESLKAFVSEIITQV